MQLQYTRAMLVGSALFLGNANYERAAQLVLLGLMLDCTKHHPIGYLTFAYLCMFALFGVVLEVVHFIFRRKYTAAREMWEHVQKIKSQCDTEVLLKLMLEQKRNLWTAKDWNEAVRSEC